MPTASVPRFAGYGNAYNSEDVEQVRHGRRVVVTGMGAVTPLGCNVDTFWSALCAGRSGIGPVTRFDASQYTCRIAGELDGWDPDSLFSKKDLRHLDQFAQYAICAAEEAVRSASLLDGSVDLGRVGVIIGSGIGGIGTTETEHERLLKNGPKRSSPFMIPMEILNMASAHVSIRHGFTGPSFAVVSACASGAHSIGDAARMIAWGDADVMVTGGTESGITPLSFAGFCAARALSGRNDQPQQASRPFDKDRDGFVMGEGSGLVVLEDLDHARRRSAPILAEISGYGASCDAHHITAPVPGGLGAAKAIRSAIDDAGLSIDDVDYINAHGTSTLANDSEETAAIKTVFGEHAYKLAVSSNKSMIGHTLGAAGAIEFIATVMTIRDGVIPATINLDEPGPGCDLDYTPHKSVERPVRVAISNSLGFGGHNSCLLAKRFEADE